MQMTLTREHIELCNKIVDRLEMFPTYHAMYNNRIAAFTDICAGVGNWHMDLYEWLNADDYDFLHDCVGIYQHINRTTTPASLYGAFVPKFARDMEENHNG